MEASRSAEEKSYEQALRVIGRHLDRESADQFRIDEIEDGFAVESESPPKGTEQRVTRQSRFPWNRLGDLDAFYTAGRGLSRRASKNEASLRKLGSQLDQGQSAGLTVTAKDGGLEVVTQSANGKQARDYSWDELR